MSSPSTTTTADESQAEIIQVELKDPRLAAFLGWLVPGAGHLYQGRIGKGLLFMICILGTWMFGMYLGAGKVVYFTWKPDEIRWAYFCQVGVGLPAMPAMLQYVHARRNPRADAMWGGFMAPPRPPNFRHQEDPGELHEWQLRLNHYFELGTVYTMIAGLLNVLAVYDAYGGPLLMPAGEDDDDEKGSDEKEPKDSDK